MSRPGLSQPRLIAKLSAATLALAFAGTLPASAQVRAQPGAVEAERNAERIDRLENQLRDMQAVLYSVEDTGSGNDRPFVPAGSGATLPGAGQMDEADMSLRIMSLEQSLAQLTGQVEELAYKLQRQQAIIDQLEGQGTPEYGAPSGLPSIDGIQNGRPAGTSPDGGPVDLMGNNGASQPMPAGDGSMTGEATAPALPQLPDDPDRAFDEAYASVLAADYDVAESKLEAFVQTFPDAPQTAEAKYLLGEIYLATGANGDAAKVFLDHVSAYPDDPRAAEVYLKLGVSFVRLNRPEEACRVFNAGVKKFPGMDDRLKARYADERAKASCS